MNVLFTVLSNKVAITANACFIKEQMKERNTQFVTFCYLRNDPLPSFGQAYQIYMDMTISNHQMTSLSQNKQII